MYYSPILYKDFYKVLHFEQYPKGTQLIVSNFTPRKSRIPGVNSAIFFGLKYFVQQYLMTDFHNYFFQKPEIAEEYKEFMKATLGVEKDFSHIKDLLQFEILPIAIFALPEGTEVPIGCPALVIFNTDPRFYWLTNMLETIMSCTLWGACTSATIAHEYRKILDFYAEKTSDNPGFVDYQAHDFSFRGMFGLEAAQISGAAHLLSFKGTDTIPAITFLNRFYGAALDATTGCSVPATEHSVMCAGGEKDEMETFRRLIEDIYPTGIISIVSDTWSLWDVLEVQLPMLKHLIMKRDGKVVIRPDSGDPIKIICGNLNGECEAEQRGVVEWLWKIFGGKVNSKGYKELDSHIGVIYGDSITLNICTEICKQLADKGFASTNIVFGIGSYTYQYQTRDSLGWAIKATHAKINDKYHAIFKNPQTDDGTKKSHKGLLKVVKINGQLKVLENVTWEEFCLEDNELKLFYANGLGEGDYNSTLEDIRNRMGKRSSEKDARKCEVANVD